MADDDRASAFTVELGNVLVAMATTPDFEERRSVFASQVQLSFDPHFLPALLQLSALMADTDRQKGRPPIVAASVFAAVCVELHEFLLSVEPETLSPSALATELMVAAIYAVVSPDGEREPGVELTKAAIRQYRRLGPWPQETFLEIERIAMAADTRAGADDELGQLMRENAQSWRGLPHRLELLASLLGLLALDGDEEQRRRLRELHTGDPDEVGFLLPAILAALTEMDEDPLAGRARDLFVVLIEEGAPVDRTALGDYLTHNGPLFGPWPEMEQRCTELASQGPYILLPSLEVASEKLRGLGSYSDQPISARISHASAQQVFERVSALVSELIGVGGDGQAEEGVGGEVVAGMLVLGLQNREPGVRGMAAMLCGLTGIPRELVRVPLMAVLRQDDEPSVQVAAATALQADVNLPGQVRELLAELLMDFASKQLPTFFAKVGAGVEAGKDAEEAVDILASGVRSMLPTMIAVRSARETEQ